MHKKYNGDNLPDLDLNVKGASSNLLAVVRCRPLLQKDLMNNSHECVSLLSDSLLLISEPYDTDGHTGSEKTRKLQFEFPRVFSKNTTNQEVYNQTAKPLLPGLFEGLNATVFCYGAAQSGKTHTMMGNNEQQGLISYALDDLQAMIEAPERMGSVMKVSYIEIHNEVIRDLLVADDKNIDIREDPVKGTIVVNISEFTTSVKKDILKAIKVGNKNKTEEIRGDMAGGKAHIILMMQIESIKTNASKSTSMTMSKFFLADLAGTEKTLGVKGKKVKEGGNVNKSLLALSNCITVLSEGKAGHYIPYRDSKLTRLLKDSLGGNSRTVMITTVSTSSRDYEETINSLKYAIRAKSIKNHAVKNVSGDVDTNVHEMKHIMDSLQRENQDLKRQLEKGNQPGPQKKMAPISNSDTGKLKGSTGGILNMLLTKIKTHFDEEKALRHAKLANEETMINLNEDMEQALHLHNDSNLVRLNHLKNERARLNDDLLIKSKERARMMDTVNESGLNSLQVTYLSNIIYKEQLDAELIDSKPGQLKADKAISHNDWNVEFLKNQVIMRDKIMTDQLDVLDSNKLETYVTYDGLRQVENLPKNIHRSNDELYLPPIFAERKSQAGLRMGVQVTSEINQKLPAISINKGGFNAQRSSLDNLYKNNLKVGQLNKLSHFEEVRNRYYKKPENERSQSRPLVYKPQYTPSRYNQSSRSNSGISQKYHPYSAYTSVRPPANRYFSGSLPKRQHEGSSYRSPIITRPDSGSLNKQFTPITNEDFTIEALQQKKMALDRLNDRMKNL